MTHRRRTKGAKMTKEMLCKVEKEKRKVEENILELLSQRMKLMHVLEDFDFDALDEELDKEVNGELYRDMDSYLSLSYT